MQSRHGMCTPELNDGQGSVTASQAIPFFLPAVPLRGACRSASAPSPRAMSRLTSSAGSMKRRSASIYSHGHACMSLLSGC